MGLFDFLKRDNKTENSTKDNGELNSHIKSMLEACFEYVEFNDKEVDAIYVLCSAETSYYFTFFFSINGNIVKKHKVNDYLIQKCNASIDQQFATDEIGLNDLEAIASLFKRENKEVPKLIKITYYPSTQKMNTDFSYDNRLIGTELMGEDLVMQWIEELKK